LGVWGWVLGFGPPPPKPKPPIPNPQSPIPNKNFDNYKENIVFINSLLIK